MAKGGQVKPVRNLVFFGGVRIFPQIYLKHQPATILRFSYELIPPKMMDFCAFKKRISFQIWQNFEVSLLSFKGGKH